jgi:hypothetical protein
VTKRRGKGEGAVYRRKDGRCIGEYDDANGKRRYVSGKTKAEVRTKLRKHLADRDAGVAYDSVNLTLGSYLDKWLAAVKGTVRQRTWQRHEEVVRLHLLPTVGHVKFDKLSALQVQAMYRQKLDSGLSRRSVEIIHATLLLSRGVPVKVVSEMLGHADVSTTPCIIHEPVPGPRWRVGATGVDPDVRRRGAGALWLATGAPCRRS